MGQSRTPLAVIFARGTFDSGNVGYWVGPDFLEAFPSEKVARQGVDAGEYPANLKEYLQGGSRSGANALATTVNAYLDLCTGAKVIISGWSQGALVAHLGLDLLDDNRVKNNVAALVTFGDPYELFDMFHLKVRVDHFHSPCITGDLLCKPKEWDIAQILKDLTAFIRNIFNKLSNVKLHRQRYEEIESLAGRFVKEANENKGTMALEVWRGHARKLALDPNHFLYGHLGYGQKAVEWAKAELPDIKAILLDELN